MVDKKQIEKWLSENVVTQEQAELMLRDTAEYKKEQSSNKFVVIISTLGSILLGVGVILFIASNWEAMPDIFKTLLLTGSTFFFYFMGYDYKYRRGDMPRVGSALLFLSGLLFGATLFLLAQIYHVEANSHTIALIWLIGILPFVYAFRSVEMAGLAAIVFYIWLGLYVIGDYNFSLFSKNGLRNVFFLPVLYLVCGLALFGAGGLHYFRNNLKGIARVFRLSGIFAAMLALLFLTFRFFSGSYEGYDLKAGVIPSESMMILVMAFSIIAAVTIIINFLYNPSKSINLKVENYTALFLIILAIVFFNFPAQNNIYVVVFSLVMAGIIFLLIQQGYLRQDMMLVNTGLFFFVIFVIEKYFDFFWGLLDRSVFFIAGGMILLVGGVYLEQKRRQIKEKFVHEKA